MGSRSAGRDRRERRDMNQRGINTYTSQTQVQEELESPPIPEKLDLDIPDLSLEHYSGQTNVPLTENLEGLYGHLNEYMEGPYKQHLSGQYDYGLLDRAVIQPGRRNLQENTLSQSSDI